jgi:K+-sensing histidine kinase KdpD
MARTTESLYVFSRKLSGAGTLDDVLWASAYQAALMLKVRVVLLLPDNGTLAVKTGYPPEDILDDADLAAAKWAWDHDRAAGPIRCPAPSGCFSPCAPAVDWWASSASTATSRGRFSPPTSGVCSTP